MNRKMPQVREFMTRAPLAVPFDTPLQKIETMMRELEIRHLPVQQNGRLVGLLSDRNVKAALMAPRGTAYEAKDAMIPNPFVAPASTPLDDIAARMAEDKYGSVLLTNDSGEIEGIFTTVDVCRALRQVLRSVTGE